jgi:hypothetical protein
MDRTNWKFGQSNIILLVIGVVYQGVAFPLFSKSWINLVIQIRKSLKKYLSDTINFFSFQTIEVLVADREFVGYEWLNYLNINKIPYHIRIRKNLDVHILRNNYIVKASSLFNGLNFGSSTEIRLLIFTGHFALQIETHFLRSRKLRQSICSSLHSLKIYAIVFHGPIFNFGNS